MFMILNPKQNLISSQICPRYSSRLSLIAKGKLGMIVNVSSEAERGLHILSHSFYHNALRHNKARNLIKSRMPQVIIIPRSNDENHVFRQCLSPI